MIPDFQTLMLPLLKLLSDGKEYKMRTVEEILAEQFSLTKEELVELLPSGTDYIFKNRIGWAKTYMKKAGLINSYKRGCITISEKGK